VKQAVQLVARKAERLVYGLFREKNWRVGKLNLPLDPEADMVLPSDAIEALDAPRGYSFIADPFPSPQGGMYCEALNSRTGKGEIVHWSSGNWTFLELGLSGGHASYPQPIAHGGSLYLLPEIAAVAGPRTYELLPGGVLVEAEHELMN
jgi:hypothetical protein